MNWIAARAPPSWTRSQHAPIYQGERMSGGYQKISINLADQVLAEVKALAEEDAVTVTEVLRRAISTHKFVEDAQRSGKRVLLHDPDTKTTERVIFR